MSEQKLVTFKINDRELQVPAGTLVIEAAKQTATEVPSFCYYPGLSLQAACRMCLVEVEKMPKMQTACTLVATEGMVVRTDTPQIRQARKGVLEFLLTNHPLDCPVCDKGGECELQDMVFRYGADTSRFVEEKIHFPEEKWSEIVYYDAPRCILCFRCVRVCDEGMDVKALGVGMRGANSVIIPNAGDHLDCEECGMCIDICPVGALTSGTYRYKTRPWEMEYVPTVCAHCSNGCKTTLSVRNHQIIRANNRDLSGINGDFLCIKGRFGFDFTTHPDRIKQPMARKDDKLFPISWEEAAQAAAAKLKAIHARDGADAIGFIGSKRPRMVAVQAEGCAPMVRAWENGEEHAPRFENAHTIASGIRVPQAVGDFLILRAVRESGGFAIAVDDAAIAGAWSEVAAEEGFLLCPEGAATYAAYKAAVADGRVGAGERAVLFNCATGLKYPMPEAGTRLKLGSPIDWRKIGTAPTL